MLTLDQQFIRFLLSEEELQYFFPGCAPTWPERQPKLSETCMLEDMVFGEAMKPRRSRSKGTSEPEIRFRVESRHVEAIPVKSDEETEDERIRKMAEDLKRLQKMYNASIDEIERALGYTVKPSRIRVEKSGEIRLVDYGNKTVKMDKLTKTVYIFYLKHLEGVRLKNLYMYREELEEIYMSISGRESVEAMSKSIDDLVDAVGNNSINEKISKAKRAFRNVIDERIARMYYIEGHAGFAKKIRITRSLIIWE